MKPIKIPTYVQRRLQFPTKLTITIQVQKIKQQTLNNIANYLKINFHGYESYHSNYIENFSISVDNKTQYTKLKKFLKRHPATSIYWISTKYYKNGKFMK